MTHERPMMSGRSETSGGRPPKRRRVTGRGATWQRVDRVLEVRSRIVFALDAIEEGDVRTAGDCLFQLLDDLDSAELLTSKAA